MTTQDGIALSELANLVDGTLGGAQATIRQVSSLDKATVDCISFYADRRYRADLSNTKAGAVIITAEHVDDCPVPTKVVKDPYYAYAKIADHLHSRQWTEPAIHPTAMVPYQVKLVLHVRTCAHSVIDA